LSEFINENKWQIYKSQCTDNVNVIVRTRWLCLVQEIFYKKLHAKLRGQCLFTEAAIQALNSLQSNAAVIDKVRQSGKLLNMVSIPEMQSYMRRLGYQV
jgi:hypothetical protein